MVVSTDEIIRIPEGRYVMVAGLLITGLTLPRYRLTWRESMSDRRRGQRRGQGGGVPILVMDGPRGPAICLPGYSSLLILLAYCFANDRLSPWWWGLGNSLRNYTSFVFVHVTTHSVGLVWQRSCECIQLAPVWALIPWLLDSYCHSNLCSIYTFHWLPTLLNKHKFQHSEIFLNGGIIRLTPVDKVNTANRHWEAKWKLTKFQPTVLAQHKPQHPSFNLYKPYLATAYCLLLSSLSFNTSSLMF